MHQTVSVIHNPGAGEGSYNRTDLLALLKKHGYVCRYFSTKKKGWKKFSTNTDIIAVAGGDGTVRKVTKIILQKKLMNRPRSVAVLPFGTANNIATALGIKKDAPAAVAAWRKAKNFPFDVGRIRNLKGEKFFMESFGCGAFAYLMKQMEKTDEREFRTTEESLSMALGLLGGIIHEYKACECRLKVDGKDYSGRYILAEIMNISSIGPNLHISRTSDPGDGLFEVVLVAEGDRRGFERYVNRKLDGREKRNSFKTIRGRDIQIVWHGDDAHVDDRRAQLLPGRPVRIHVLENALTFLVP